MILLLNDNFLESFNKDLLIFPLKITAAATTGPAKLPLPTSSTPADILALFNFDTKFFNFIPDHF